MAYRKSILEKLVAAKKLTTDGSDWLKLALDPFHDFNHQIAGYPDADGSQTVVSCYQYQLDVSKPAGSVGNWDCHVFNTPITRTCVNACTNESATWSSVTPPVVASNGTFGLLTIQKGDAGASLYPTIVATANSSTTALPAIGVDDAYLGLSRIIGMGFEVTNVTAELNKQGTVTTYRQPQAPQGTSVAWTPAAGTHQGVVNAQRVRSPPQTVGSANSLKGARTWDAAQGVYVTCVQGTVANPLLSPSNTLILQSANASPAAATTTMATPVELVGAMAAPPACSTLVPEPNKCNPFLTSGAYFTGLSPTTILTVKLKVYVEKAPSHTEANLAVLASPSAGYDMRALEFYAKIITELPVAVKVGDNASGDWWRDALRAIGTVAAETGSLLTPAFPAAKLIGQAVKAGTELATRKKTRREQKPPAAPQRVRNVEAGTLVAKGKRRG